MVLVNEFWASNFGGKLSLEHIMQINGKLIKIQRSHPKLTYNECAIELN